MKELLPLDLLLSPLALALLGLCIGSFLNVVIHRLPLILERQWWADVAHQLADEESWRRVFGEGGHKAGPSPAHQLTAKTLGQAVDGLAPLSIASPRSRCPACSHALRWHENLPLIGWLKLKGRCSACATRISARYPVVELCTALLFGAIAWRFGAQPTTLLWCGFGAALVALAMIDWDTTVLPDALTLPLLWAGLIAAALDWTLPLPTAAWGAVAGYLSLWSVYWLFKLATGKEGMGYGDFKMLAALGAFCGVAGLLPIVLLSSLIGAVVGGIWLAAKGRDRATPIPFGPFLAAAGWLQLVYGERILALWPGIGGP